VRLPAGISLNLRSSRDGGAGGVEIPFALTPALSVTARADAQWNSLGEAVSLYGAVGFEYAFVAFPPFLPDRGWLEGIVFVDSTADGRPDPGEDRIGGAVLVADGTRVSSGTDGRFLFPPLPPGGYALGVERLPSGLRPLVALPLRVEVGLGGRTTVYIPCERLGEIAGVVYHDGDRTGTREDTEAGLARVRVLLQQEGTVVGEAFTDLTGAFVFPDLAEGAYEVALDAGSLPERYELTTPAAIGVNLAPGAREEVLFGAWQRPRPVVVVYRPPIADFTWSPVAPQAGQPVTFDAGASAGEIVKYTWEFTGDDAPDAEGSVAIWTFPDPGFYLVTLIVTDDEGLEDRVGLLVQVVP